MSQRVDDLVSINLDATMLGQGWMAKVDGKSKRVPSLLDQLRAVLTQTTPSGEGGNASGKPVTAQMPGNEGPLSLVIEIEVEVGRLAVELGASAGSSSCQGNLAFIEREVARSEDQVVAHVAWTLAGLARRAESELQWTEAPRRLHARCPECQAFGTITVRLDAGGLHDARCSNCEALWGRADLGALASLLNDAG